MKDLTNFNKLPLKEQDKIIRAFIKKFPKEQQAKMRKELLV